MFPFIQIEKRNYPTIILGEDHFTGWFPKSKILYESETERGQSYFETLQTAYDIGVRGFSISPHKTLIKILKNFKKDHKDIVCIANPHFHKNYYFNGESLWTEENWNRTTATIYPFFEKYDLQKISWFKDISKYKPFSKLEIKKFQIDLKEYNDLLAEFSEFCDFSLIGNFHRSALLLLGRQDIVSNECKQVRKHKMVPILMCEAGVPALEATKNIEVPSYWVYMNENFGIPTIADLISYLNKNNKYVTAYKAFTRDGGFNPKESLKFFKTIKNVSSLVVGVETKEQTKETFSQIAELS